VVIYTGGVVIQAERYAYANQCPAGDTTAEYRANSDVLCLEPFVFPGATAAIMPGRKSRGGGADTGAAGSYGGGRISGAEFRLCLAVRI
jgi:hypothetical protein